MEHASPHIADRSADFVGSHGIILSVMLPGTVAPYRIGISIIRSLITARCDVSDLEIAAFAVHRSLLPWVNTPTRSTAPRLHVLPLPREIARAISAFSHNGPVFDARLGAVTAFAAPSPVPAPPSAGDPNLTLSLPDGAQSIVGNQLLSTAIRDHWLAHRETPLPPGAVAMTAQNGLPILKTSIAAMMASVLLDAKLSPDAGLDPEIYWYAVRHLIAPSTRMWPHAPHDVWNAIQLGETLAIAKSWIREDPTDPQGFRWRKGPCWHDAIASVPKAAIDLGDTLSSLVSRTKPELVEAACTAIAEVAGVGYAATFNAIETIDHTAHARIGALPLLDELDEISRKTAADPELARWLTRPLSDPS